MQLTLGTLLHGGTYKIEKVLGQGSFGITYLAEHTSLGRKVAIKEFFMKELNSRGEDGSITGLTDGSLSYNYALKFRKEAQNLARMDNPNIVRVTDCFDENGTFYYVMDYIEGQDLNSYVKHHAISETEAVSIITDVANALIYMHEEKHMLHLDLKPGNVMRRNSDGHIFLIDFGLSKHFSTDGQPETSTTIGLGTPGYAPIEQSNRAANGEFRPTIDVYALGATLYKLLTRETPPPASDLVSDDELLAASMRDKGISQKFVDIVEKSMMPNVRKRTQTVSEFKQALKSTSSTNTITSQKAEEVTDNEETLFVNTQQPKITEEKKITSEVSGTPKQTESQSSSVKYIIGIIAACLIGVGIFFAVSPSYEKKYIEAVNLQNGYGVDVDEEKAFEIFKELSDKGYGPATFEVMQAYRFGNGVESDSIIAESYKTKTVEQLQKYADKGDMYAEYCLGRCYEDGYCVTESESQSKNWFEKSSNQGYSAAQCKLGLIYFFEAKNETDYAVLDSVAVDTVVADTAVVSGANFSQSAVTAFNLLQKSANQNYPQGQYWLAECYEDGIGTDINENLYLEWIKKAADNNESNALRDLGNCYLSGHLVTKNEKKGFECLKKAVDFGHPFAASDLAYCYYQGLGTSKNLNMAIETLEPVAEAFQSPSDQYALYVMYSDKNDINTAIKWCKLAAEQGEPNAQYALAWRYQQGAGVKANQKVAEQWYRKAIANGYQE